MDGLSGMQKKLISEIYDQFSPAAYENGSNDNVRLKTLIIPNWLAKAETLFSKDKLWELFYFMEGEKIVSISPDSYILEQVPKCHNHNFIVKVHLIVYVILAVLTHARKRELSVGTNGAGLKITYGSCSYSTSSGICDRDDYGCGYMGLWTCNGNTCTF